jgi:hypothetical protein
MGWSALFVVCRFSNERKSQKQIKLKPKVSIDVGVRTLFGKGPLDLGVMNPESAAAYNAFQRIHSTFRGKTVV